MTRNRFRRATALGATGVLLVTVALAQSSAAIAAGTTITIKYGTARQSLSKGLFGAQNNYASSDQGEFDAANNQVYPTFVSQVKTAGFTAMRFPGGTMANTYHFTRAIGPQAQRTPNVDGQLSDSEPLDNTFGPDEYGAFLDQTGMSGHLMLNFATGTADEAANFVEYMTAPAGTNPRGGTAWAERWTPLSLMPCNRVQEVLATWIASNPILSCTTTRSANCGERSVCFRNFSALPIRKRWDERSRPNAVEKE